MAHVVKARFGNSIQALTAFLAAAALSFDKASLISPCTSSFLSASDTTPIAVSTLSGVREIDSMPFSTRNAAKSGLSLGA